MAFNRLSRKVVITGFKRTPIGSLMGSLSTLTAPELGAKALLGAIQSSNLTPDQIEDVYVGHVIQSACKQSPARQASLRAGIPEHVPVTNVNKVCASGMKAIQIAATNIAAGFYDIAAAAGMESMSNIPYLLLNMRKGQLLGEVKANDALMYDGLTDAYSKTSMGLCAEKTAIQFNISRQQQDEYCLQSYSLAAKYWASGFYKDQIVPIEIKGRKGITKVAEDEEFKKILPDKVPSLKPVFDPKGTITAANASSINDGASAVVLMSEDKAKQLGITPLARILFFADGETTPELFPQAPSIAVEKIFKKTGLNAQSINYWECNEAFSLVPIAFAKQLGIQINQVNQYGGAVALGHPIGMSGNRIVGQLISALKERKESLGIAAICNGGGGGSAILVENL